MDISIEHAVTNYFTHWLVAHPYLAWAISHPLPGVGLLLVLIFALSGLIRAVGRGFEQIWLFLLKTPFRLLQPLFRWMWRSIERIFGHTSSRKEQLEFKGIATAQPEQIERIIDRLQAIHQEQQDLVGELSTLLGATSVKAELDNRSDTQYKNLYAKLLK
jgi:signal transduction histidine kinase